jgi:hypothetical protein
LRRAARKLDPTAAIFFQMTGAHGSPRETTNGFRGFCAATADGTRVAM